VRPNASSATVPSLINARRSNALVLPPDIIVIVRVEEDGGP
jgi:hypothetical protein